MPAARGQIQLGNCLPVAGADSAPAAKGFISPPKVLSNLQRFPTTSNGFRSPFSRQQPWSDSRKTEDGHETETPLSRAPTSVRALHINFRRHPMATTTRWQNRAATY